MVPSLVLGALREIRGRAERGSLTPRRVLHDLGDLLVPPDPSICFQPAPSLEAKTNAFILLIGARFLTLRQMCLVKSKGWISEEHLLEKSVKRQVKPQT